MLPANAENILQALILDADIVGNDFAETRLGNHAEVSRQAVRSNGAAVQRREHGRDTLTIGLVTGSTEGVVEWIFNNGFDSILITEDGIENYICKKQNIKNIELIHI